MRRTGSAPPPGGVRGVQIHPDGGCPHGAGDNGEGIVSLGDRAADACEQAAGRAPEEISGLCALPGETARRGALGARLTRKCGEPISEPPRPER